MFKYFQHILRKARMGNSYVNKNFWRQKGAEK